MDLLVANGGLWAGITEFAGDVAPLGVTAGIAWAGWALNNWRRGRSGSITELAGVVLDRVENMERPESSVSNDEAARLLEAAARYLEAVAAHQEALNGSGDA